MTRLNFLQNRRLITIALLLITLVFGAIAVFLAITINNRNVNPGDTAAEGCTDYRNNPANYNCDGYCDSTTCPGKSFCCTRGVNCSADAQCPEARCQTVDGGTRCGSEAGCPDGQGKQIRTRKCAGKPDEDVSDRDCTPKPGCRSNTPAPTLPVSKCNEYDNNSSNNGCPSSNPIKKCAQWCSRCPSSPGGTDGAGCVETCSACGGTAAPSVTPNPSIEPPNTSGWPAGATCRYEAGGGKCAQASFRGGACKPGDRQMCYCRNEILTRVDPSDGKTYRYGTVEIGPLGCNAECDSPGKLRGGYFNDTDCGNTYYCSPKTTPPPPTPTVPPPTCTTECIDGTTTYVTYCTPPGGTRQEVSRTTGPMCGGTTTCRPSTECEQTDLVTRDCRGSEISRIEFYPPCMPPTQTQIGACTSLSVSYAGKSATSNNPTVNTPVKIDSLPAAGQQITFNSSGSGSSKFNAYWMRPYDPNPNAPINTYGTIEHRCGFYIFNADQNRTVNATFTMPANFPSRVVRNDSFGQANCQNYPMDFSQGAIFGANYVPNADGSYTMDMIWCRNVSSTPDRGVLFKGSTPLGQSCPSPCVILANPAAPSACTGISITNTRNNATCNATNPQNCQVRQGDTLSATVSGSGNTTGYSLQSTASPGGSPQARIIQQSPTFGNITIPNNTALQNFEIIGYTSNGSETATADACRIRFDFSTDTGVQKTINASGSTGLGANNVVTTGSVVEYDLTVTNNGTGVLQNVLVYDRLVQIDNGTPNPTTTPFGNIISASNLARTTGTLSQPDPVTPRQGYPSNAVPFSGTPISGGTFTNGQGIKLVTWNSITTFNPGEAYTGKVRVQIDTYTGTPVLRNYVCIVVDSNNNGQPDSGELSRCAYQDVNTSTPEFTITKTSSVSSSTPGNSLTYTLTLRNTSANPLGLSGVTVTDTFDTRYIDRVTIIPQNGGSLSGNVITWDGTDLIAANSGNAQLAANGTITLTVQVTFNANFFPSTATCVLIVDNSAVASSTSPNFTTPPATVQITMNNPACGVRPTPTTTLPPTAVSAPLYLPIGAMAALLTAIAAYWAARRYKWFTKKRNSDSQSNSPIEELRKKVRGRK